MAKKKFGQRAVNANIFGSLMAGDFINLSCFGAEDQVIMSRTIIVAFQSVQQDVTLRGVEVTKELQAIFLENIDKVEPDRLFDDVELPAEQNIARQGKINYCAWLQRFKLLY